MPPTTRTPAPTTSDARPDTAPHPWLEALARSLWLNPFWLVPPSTMLWREAQRAAETDARGRR